MIFAYTSRAWDSLRERPGGLSSARRRGRRCRSRRWRSYHRRSVRRAVRSNPQTRTVVVTAHPMVAGAAMMNDARRRWHERSRWERQIRRARRSRWGHGHRRRWRWNDAGRQTEGECRKQSRPNGEFHPAASPSFPGRVARPGSMVKKQVSWDLRKEPWRRRLCRADWFASIVPDPDHRQKGGAWSLWLNGGTCRHAAPQDRALSTLSPRGRGRGSCRGISATAFARRGRASRDRIWRAPIVTSIDRG